MEYQQYPMVMNHPSYQRARKIAEATPAIPPSQGKPLIPAQPEQWEPERWPQVTVNTADDEEYYAAKGYKPAGQGSAQAFSSAHASPYVAGRAVSEYPKMVDGVLVQDPQAPTSSFQAYPKWLKAPGDGEAILVNSAAEEEALLAQWTDPNAPPAPGPRKAVAADFETPPKDDDDDDEEDEKGRQSAAPSTLKVRPKHEQRAR